jgi:CRP/FNR family transcriptional regulator
VQNITVGHAEKIALLVRNSYFEVLDSAALDNLAKSTTLRHYERDEVICWQGDVCPGLMIVHKGVVKLFKLSPKGRELIVRIMETGATFNEAPVFDYGTNPINVAALEESEIWVIEPGAIRSTLAQYPEMARAVIQNLSKNLRMLVGIVEELSFYQVTNRLARLISRLPNEQIETDLIYHVTQDQLAARLGTVREVVARSLRDLERSGAIRVRRREITVVDERLLQAWAQEAVSE